MEVIRSVEPLARYLDGLGAGERISFVPTMGALHEGHGACVARARSVARARVLVSIFVNPTQFGPGEDVARYPRPLDADLARLDAWGCHAAFVPSVDTMYPTPQRAWVEVDEIAQPLCGRFRPGHFRGVATVVSKLFHMVRADAAVFGQKDAQQALVIRAMVRGLDFPVRLLLAGTVREPDGLAMSSRNAYLSPGERTQASALYRALGAGRASLEAGERDARAIEGAAADVLRRAGIDRVDYAEVRRADDLSALDRVEGRAILALAAWVGRARLIDNMVFDVESNRVASDVALFDDDARE
ncbi:MAG TPA: pantoate--beta-alanine ligase [Candidatus Krumholzibacteria bacterium]|nr:pantoate--beta-alanine ligase [Candidatus Krumholzibacteria bacterium]